MPFLCQKNSNHTVGIPASVCSVSSICVSSECSLLCMKMCSGPLLTSQVCRNWRTPMGRISTIARDRIVIWRTEVSWFLDHWPCCSEASGYLHISLTLVWNERTHGVCTAHRQHEKKSLPGGCWEISAECQLWLILLSGWTELYF